METTTRELLLEALVATGYHESECDEPKLCGTDWGRCVPCMAKAAVKQAREEGAEFLAVHRSPHGLNVFIVEAQEQPSEEEVAGLCDFDNSRDESIDIHRLSDLAHRKL
jgi:hypothetical protein